MENQNKDNNKELWWRPAVVFYGKTTGWIVFPLIIALFFGRYIKESTGSQVWFFVAVFAGFTVTCYGIYREINLYKKDLDKEEEKKDPPSQNAADGQGKNGK